jgi:plastocyanin
MRKSKKLEVSMESTDTKQFFKRQSPTALGWLVITGLVMTAIPGIVTWSIVGNDAIALLIIAAVLFLAAGIVATGIRWTPLLGSLLGAGMLIISALQPYVIYHLTQPKAGNFLLFVMVLLTISSAIITLGSGITATWQNYSQHTHHTPTWLTPALTSLAGIFVGAILIAAIAQPAPAATATGGGEPTVHMGAGNFVQSSVTISKGSKLMLVDDTNIPHILANGTWQNGTPKPAIEPGAPTVNNIQVAGNSVEIGPFNTAGTYHVYCTVHPGMTLTIIVQ